MRQLGDLIQVKIGTGCVGIIYMVMTMAAVLQKGVHDDKIREQYASHGYND